MKSPSEQSFCIAAALALASIALTRCSGTGGNTRSAEGAADGQKGDRWSGDQGGDAGGDAGTDGAPANNDSGMGPPATSDSGMSAPGTPDSSTTVSISVTDPTLNGGDVSVCSGISHDDRPAFQAAMDYASANGIPIVTMPAATCYMNSHGGVGAVTGNLRLPSGVTLQGTPGASKILQTPSGRPTCGSLCTVVVINIGTFFPTWKSMGCPLPPNPDGPCTGYYALNTPTVGSNVVTLMDSSQASNFHLGDYITIYDHQPVTSDDVINGFQSTVTSVNGATITLADNMARSWPTSYIGDLSSSIGMGVSVGHDMGIDGVIVEGSCALSMTESFNVTLKNNQFITDTDLYDSTHQYIAAPQWNSIEHYTFDNNQFISIGTQGNIWSAEMTQRNSGFGTWTNNTIGVAGAAGFNSWGLSEFAHDITFSGNHVYTNPSGSQPCGFSLSAQTGTISNNDFHTSGPWNQPGGGFICDLLSLAPYYPQYGNMTYSGNTITCDASGGGTCVALQAIQGTKFIGNTITVPPGSGSAAAIGLQYYPGDAQINNNTISIQGGAGLSLNFPFDGGWTVNGNTITSAAGSGTGISINNAGMGTCQIQNNTSGSGFANNLSVSSPSDCAMSNNH
jgi:hypothetical protein